MISLHLQDPGRAKCEIVSVSAGHGYRGDAWSEAISGDEDRPEDAERQARGRTRRGRSNGVRGGDLPSEGILLGAGIIGSGGRRICGTAETQPQKR